MPATGGLLRAVHAQPGNVALALAAKPFHNGPATTRRLIRP
jgi:hypothetical protein